jgi:drug/metabolite transporter (DMT)-like permease
MLNSFVVVLSEIALALYPILIKTVPTDIQTQLVARLLTYTVLGFSLASLPDIQQTWFTATGVLRSTGLGALTLLHVATSYFAFQQLPAGISMSLFYTYPIWNIVAGALFFGEALSVSQISLIGLAFLGVLLVSSSAKDSEEKTLNWKGIVAGLSAALTETAMYFAVRTAKQPNPFFAVLELYPGALPLLLLGLASTKSTLDWRGSTWIPLLTFNTFIGFVGYCLRFYAIPRLPILVFSLLSFVGVIASFLWGYLFVQEVPTVISGLGAALIATAAGMSKGG